MAASAMTETILPPEMLANLSVCLFLKTTVFIYIHCYLSLPMSRLSLRHSAILMVLTLPEKSSKSVLVSLLK